MVCRQIDGIEKKFENIVKGHTVVALAPKGDFFREFC
jgi:hypothetical protein